MLFQDSLRFSSQIGRQSSLPEASYTWQAVPLSAYSAEVAGEGYSVVSLIALDHYSRDGALDVLEKHGA